MGVPILWTRREKGACHATPVRQLGKCHSYPEGRRPRQACQDAHPRARRSEGQSREGPGRLRQIPRYFPFITLCAGAHVPAGVGAEAVAYADPFLPPTQAPTYLSRTPANSPANTMFSTAYDPSSILSLAPSPLRQLRGMLANQNSPRSPPAVYSSKDTA